MITRILGDAYYYMRSLPDGHFDHIITDPIYGEPDYMCDCTVPSIDTNNRKVCAVCKKTARV